MPVYGYKCSNKKCKFYFEAMQSIKALPLTTCPKCGKELKKRFFPITFMMDVKAVTQRFK